VTAGLARKPKTKESPQAPLVPLWSNCWVQSLLCKALLFSIPAAIYQTNNEESVKFPHTDDP